MEDESEKLLRSHNSLDDIPVPILLHILSLLPIKEAIRTSVLSKRWRYLWTNMPIFKIQDFSIPRRDGLIKTIQTAFALRDSSLSLNTLYVGIGLLGQDDVFLINSWVSAALSHNVQRLFLNLPFNIQHPYCEPPSRMFNNQSLIELDLEIRTIYIPSSFHLPNLKILRFKSISLLDHDDGSIHKLLSLGSLHVLEIYNCHFPNLEALHIFAPNLRELVITRNKIQVIIQGCNNSLMNFTYDGVPLIDYRVSSSSSLLLTSAQVHITKNFKLFDDERIWIEHTGHYMYKLLKEFSSVKFLSLSFPALEFLNRDNKLLHELPTFQNILELHLFNFNINFGFDASFAILRRMPRLEKLHLYGIESLAYCKTNDYILGPIPSCIQSYLKKIRISKFTASKEALFIVRHLLLYAYGLEELDLFLITSKKKCRMAVFRQIIEFPRASKNCKIAVS